MHAPNNQYGTGDDTTVRPGGEVRQRARLSVAEKIDISRGVFAILVVIAHGCEIMTPIPQCDFRSQPEWLRALIMGFPAAGIHWVMGFFVISGFCIHLSVSRLQQGEAFPLKTYLAARLTRIFPLYYAALLFAVVVEWVIAPARPCAWPLGVHNSVLLAQVFCIQNLTQTYGSFAPSWSITNEFFYYIFYGLLACVLIKQRERMSGVGLLICATVAAVFQLLYLTPLRSPLVYSTGMLFALGLFWFLGAFMAQHARTFVQSPVMRISARAWLPLLAVGLYCKYDTRLPLQGFYVFSGLAFVLMLARFLQAPEPEPGAVVPRWRVRLIEGLGLISYPMYLFHAPFMMLIGSAIMRWRLLTDWRLIWFVLSSAGILFGIALGYLAERPLMRRRAAWLKRRSVTAPTARREPVPRALGTAG